jgi:hypothetical protein
VCGGEKGEQLGISMLAMSVWAVADAAMAFVTHG